MVVEESRALGSVDAWNLLLGCRPRGGSWVSAELFFGPSDGYKCYVYLPHSDSLNHLFVLWVFLSGRFYYSEVKEQITAVL